MNCIFFFLLCVSFLGDCVFRRITIRADRKRWRLKMRDLPPEISIEFPTRWRCRYNRRLGNGYCDESTANPLCVTLTRLQRDWFNRGNVLYTKLLLLFLLLLKWIFFVRRVNSIKHRRKATDFSRQSFWQINLLSGRYLILIKLYTIWKWNSIF